MNRVIKIGLIVLTAVLIALLVATPLVGGNYIPKIVNGEDLTNDITESILSVEQGFYNSYLPFLQPRLRLSRPRKIICCIASIISRSEISREAIQESRTVIGFSI